MSVFGFPKSFGLAGLRIGCVYTTSGELFEKIVENSDVMTTAGGIASISQVAGQACMDKACYWVGICFATSREILKEGLDRLEKGIQMLMKEKNLTE